jgi:hypothetical protein
MLKKLVISDRYQPRGSHLIKRKTNALFITALLAMSSSGTTRAHAQSDIGLGADLRAVGQLLCGAPLNTAGETMVTMAST